MPSLSQCYLSEVVPTCSGCEACVNICPVDAISMQRDKHGFRFPVISESVCVGCRMCLDICPVLNPDTPILHRFAIEPKVYAAWAQDQEITEKSSSGGMFFLLAEKIISQGGYVFGAVLSDQLRAEHRMASNTLQIMAMQGSKYIQSHIGFVYREVKSRLRNGSYVLFSGTPCQIAGLLCFLGKHPPKLITCEVLCHGVPSDTLFEKYVDWMQRRFRSSLLRLAFRDKRQGWKKYGLVHVFSNGKIYFECFQQNPYMSAYLKNLCLRKGCFTCPATRLPRVADITLGDFWGIERFHPEWKNSQGISLVLLNSVVGMSLFESIGSRQKESFPMPLQQAVKKNPIITRPVCEHAKRFRFLEDLNRFSFSFLRLKYARFIWAPAIRAYEFYKKLIR